MIAIVLSSASSFSSSCGVTNFRWAKRSSSALMAVTIGRTLPWICDFAVASLLDGAHQDHLLVLIGRLDDGDGVVVVVRNDDQGRGDSRDGQHAHRGDRDDSFADPRRQDGEHYGATSLRMAIL